jgi:segregation and condensation protein B
VHAGETKAVIEGLLFVSGDEGLEMKQIADVLEISHDTAVELMDELKSAYKEEERGIELAEIAGMYKLMTKATLAPYIQRLIESPGSSTLSQAALETLAIVAYKQPITRAEIEDVRGVKTERALHTLTSKALIKKVGRAQGAGRAILYGTTAEFLEHFGLKLIEELPPLPEEDDQSLEESELFFEKFKETLKNT